MLAPSPAPRPTSLDDLLGRAFMARLDRLDVLSRKVFMGKLPGERRSKKRGASVEFDDYREYVPGDDLRRLDWNVFARFDRFIIKLFREEEDLSVHLVIDASASMDAGEPTSKLAYALRLAMGLGYVGLIRRNRVTASIFAVPGRPLVQTLAPLRDRRGIHALAEFLLERAFPPEGSAWSQPLGWTNAGGTASTNSTLGLFNASLRNIALARKGKGVMVLLSDGLVREDPRIGLSYLASGAGYDTTLVQVLDPLELDPSLGVERGLSGDLRLTDIETGRASEVTISAALVRQYKDRAKRHVEGIKSACAARGIGHVLVQTSDDPLDLIVSTLRQRGLVG